MKTDVRHEAEIFFGEIVSAYERGGRSKALFRLYDRVETDIEAGDASFVDTLLDVSQVDGIPLSVLIGLLTSTLPYRSKLNSRAPFLEKVRQRITKEDPNRLKSLLGGL